MKPFYFNLLFCSLFVVQIATAQSTLPYRQLDTNLPVGATAGAAGVNLSGAATYSIPIFVSPGTAGMQPKISIEYNSQAGNGLLGIGWNIGGLSAITRVPQDYYHDGVVNGVDLQADDRFAWDGSRLIAASGTYGASGTVYATEIESFAKITSNGTAGTGPQSFTVVTKDNTTIEYGTTVDSRVELTGNATVLTWRISKITDANGNYINYYYTLINGESLVDRIEYTGNTAAGIAPYNKLSFVYEDRPDKGVFYVAGQSVQSTKRLKTIKMESENQLVRQYDFTYLPSEQPITVFSRLSAVQETGNDGTKLNPTLINWGNQGTEAEYYSISSQTSSVISRSFFADLNGDGLEDQFIITANSGASSFTQWFYFQSNGNTYTKVAQGNIPVTDCNNVVITDIDNDGINNILFRTKVVTSSILTIANPTNNANSEKHKDKENQGHNNNVWDSISNQWVKVDTTQVLAIPTPGTTITEYFYYSYYFSGNSLTRGNTADDFKVADASSEVLPGNFNGDGKTDILILSTAKDFYAAKGITVSSAPSFNAPTYAKVIDVDGDGIDEVFTYKSSVYNVFKYTPATSTFSCIFSGTFSGITAIRDLKTGDFNGDGKTDILLVPLKPATTCHYELHLSAGTTFTAALTTPSIPQIDNLNGLDSNNEVIISDINGDGKADICHFYKNLAIDFTVPGDEYNILNGRNVCLFFSAGNNGILEYIGYRDWDADYLIVNKEVQFAMADTDGDGCKDINLVVNPSTFPDQSNTFNGVLLLSNNKWNTNRVQSITDGLNNSVGFSYTTLSNATAGRYTKGTGSVFPINDIQPPMPVVATFSAWAGYLTNAQQAIANTEYYYAGLQVHLQGKGGLGFSKVTAVNSLTNAKTESNFALNGTYYFKLPSSSNTYAGSTLTATRAPVYQINDWGNKRLYIYPQQQTTTDALTNTTVSSVFTYDNYGNRLTQTDTYGADAVIINTMEYEAKGIAGINNRMKKHTVSSKYTSDPNPTAFSKEQTYTYDAQGNMLTTTNFSNLPANAITTAYTLNTCGLPKSVSVSATGMVTRTTRTDYDAKYRVALRTIDAKGQKLKRDYNFGLGVVVADSLPNGLTNTYNYNGFGQLLSSTQNQLNLTTTLQRSYAAPTDPAGAIYTVTTTIPGKPYVKACYDIYGREIRTETTGLNSAVIYADKSYAPASYYGQDGQLTSQTYPYYPGETPDLVQYKYDAYGRNTEINDRGMTTATAYNGKTITLTDPMGRSSSKTVNALGNIITATDNGGSVAYAYHNSGQPLNITAAGAATTLQYDACGRQTQLIDPDAGATAYTYNAFGELYTQTDARGNTATMQYDELGRLLTKTLAGQTTTYAYQTAGGGIGQLQSVAHSNGTTQSYTYDAYGRLNTSTQTIPGQSALTTTYGYDTYGNNTTITYPETGYTLTNLYSNGILTEVKNNAASIWKLTEVTSHGLPKTTIFGNGLSTTYTYDMDQLTQIVTGSVQNEYTPVYHPNIGNISMRKDNLTGQYESFTFDTLDRLTGIAYMGGGSQSIAYSPNGNITHKFDGGAYAYGSKPHAVASVTKTAGNTPQPLQDIAYTPFNKAQNITQHTPVTNKLLTYAITYGADEQRVKTVFTDTLNNTTTRYYAGLYEKEVKTGGTTRQLHYIYGGTGLVAVYIKWNTGQDSLYYVCKDRQGSITALLRQNGTVAERYSYDAWGRRRNPANWQDYNVKAPRLLARGYTGHEHLDGFGLINMNGRMYDPAIGRVLSPDNYVQDPTNTQNYNRYSYCLNNPLRYTDPSGWYTLDADKIGREITLRGSDFYNYYANDYWNWGTGGGGYQSMPGIGKNGTGLGGIYYDWSTGAYRSTGTGNTEVSWQSTFTQIRPYFGPSDDLPGWPGISVIENQYGKWVYTKDSRWVQVSGQNSTPSSTAKAQGGNYVPALFLLNTVNTLYNENAIRNLKALQREANSWIKITGKSVHSINNAIEANKFIKIVTESAGKKLYGVGVVFSAVSIYQDPSASNIAWNVADNLVGIVAFIPGLQIPALIYFTVRISYDVYDAYKKDE